MVNVSVKDLTTNITKTFNTLTKATDYVSELLNKKVQPAILRQSATLYKKPYLNRFVISYDNNPIVTKSAKTDNCNKFSKIKGWNINQFKKSNAVIEMDKVYKLYDEPFFEEIEQLVKSTFPKSDFTYKQTDSEAEHNKQRWNKVLKELRNHTRIYVFVKLDNSTLFKDKLKQTQSLRDNIDKMFEDYCNS